ncbi:MAG TPA: hypothetical protein VGB77_08230 [Abditibacteriaceae bacterium]
MSDLSASRLLCREIHREGHDCEAPIEPSWTFCPSCGRRTASLSLENTHLRFRHDRQKNLWQSQLSLHYRGFASLIFTAKLNEQAGSLYLVSSDHRVVRRISKRAVAGHPITLTFQWSGADLPPHDQPLQIELQIGSEDDTPDDAFETTQTNRWRPWNTQWLRVSRPAPPRLVIETQLCLFGSQCRERLIHLFNAGETTLELRPPLEPVGYSLKAQPVPGDHSAPWNLMPGQRKAYKIEATPNAKSGRADVVLERRDGHKLGSIVLINGDAARVQAQPRYVIGVDFGTAGTSVWVRDGRNDRLKAQALRDDNARAGEDPLRFPTLIYVRQHNGHESGFFIGYNALIQSENDGPGRGFLVRELKTLLRQEDEPFVEQYGPNYTIDLLLRRYLETLKNQIIDPKLSGEPEGTIAWNFSLPVLDSHESGAGVLFNRQKERLNRAIHAAGLLTGNEPQFFKEPYCAAIYLLLGYGNYQPPIGKKLESGQWACIFDSGGGTTDVVLGKLGREPDGRLSFQEVTTLGAYLNDRGEVATFGGELLTRRTAIYLSVWGPKGTPKHDYLKEADFVRRVVTRRNALHEQALYEQLKRIATRAARDGDEILITIDEDDEDLKNNPWVIFDLLKPTDAFKRQIGNLGAPAAKTNIIVRHPDKTTEDKGRVITAQRGEFDEQVVNKRLRLVHEEMLSRVFKRGNHKKTGDEMAMESSPQPSLPMPAPIEVDWVFGVGGNCRLARIGDYLQETFLDRVQLLGERREDGSWNDEDRMLAVSGGVVWASLAQRGDAMPYNLRVHDEKGVIWSLSANESLSRVPALSQSYQLPPGQSMRFHLAIEGEVTVGGKAAPFAGAVGAFELCNDDWSDSEPRSLAVRLSVERRRFRAQRRLNENQDINPEWQTIFDYAI